MKRHSSTVELSTALPDLILPCPDLAPPLHKAWAGIRAVRAMQALSTAPNDDGLAGAPVAWG